MSCFKFNDGGLTNETLDLLIRLYARIIHELTVEKERINILRINTNMIFRDIVPKVAN